MKIKNKIKKYLKQQDYYQNFINNVGPNGISSYNIFTIENAFIWTLTPEGYDYWKLIDKEFKKWYNE